jgi:hypothetical protein
MALLSTCDGGEYRCGKENSNAASNLKNKR